jgi:SAM-dependent methyltransferase
MYFSGPKKQYQKCGSIRLSSRMHTSRGQSNMDGYLNDLNSYWDSRFKGEGKIWGDSPSRTAPLALEFFKRHAVHKILVPGSGYGRHTKFFSSQGYDVYGVELSEKACAIAKQNNPNTKLIHGSYLDIAFDDAFFDAVYCFNVLHLLREKERRLFVHKCHAELANEGICFFTVFSDEEESYGKGQEVEPNTFESKPNRPVHYFSGEEIKNQFHPFDIIEENIINDPENHGEAGEHTHRLRYILCQKTA